MPKICARVRAQSSQGRENAQNGRMDAGHPEMSPSQIDPRGLQVPTPISDSMPDIMCGDVQGREVEARERELMINNFEAQSWNMKAEAQVKTNTIVIQNVHE